MEKLVFSCMIGSRAAEHGVALLTASLRKFAGNLSSCPVWALVPGSEDKITDEMKERLSSLGVQIFPVKFEPEELKFPFAVYTRAAATAESLAEEKIRFLYWFNPDTLIIKEPARFLLDEGKNLGYRPVHHTLIGSIYDRPLDPFWQLIYSKCNVAEEKVFPMKTHVDHNTLRPYFNAGCLIVRPERGLLQAWWEQFKAVYRDSGFVEFYKKNELYAIFIHQAILSAVILSKTDNEELYEIPFNYNYPLHLYGESPEEYRPRDLNDLVTARYEKLEILEKFQFQDPFGRWLADQLKSFSK